MKFQIDENGIVHVEATDLGTGRRQAVQVTPASGLSQDEVDRLVREGELFQQTDAARRELAEARNQAEALLFTTEEALTGYADLIDGRLLDEVKADCAKLRGLLEKGSDLAAIHEAHARLEGAAYRIAESMYGGAGDGTSRT